MFEFQICIKRKIMPSGSVQFAIESKQSSENQFHIQKE